MAATMHICTRESFRAGINEPPMNWFVCGKKTMYSDWVGASCDTCGADTAWEGDTAGFVRTIRERTKLSRKQIALRSGYKQSTIKSYEWKRPSQRYIKWLMMFIKGFYWGEAKQKHVDVKITEQERRLILDLINTRDETQKDPHSSYSIWTLTEKLIAAEHTEIKFKTDRLKAELQEYKIHAEELSAQEKLSGNDVKKAIASGQLMMINKVQALIAELESDDT